MRRNQNEPLPPALPGYERWLKNARGQAVPGNAAEIMPRLRAAFAAEGAPPELAWMAEVESGLDSKAGGFWGTKGLFQLSRDAARAEGLSTFLPDERTDPDLAAHAVAKRLVRFYREFGSWPLALAAYNAGRGRVERAVAVAGTSYFGLVARQLPSSTRRYVPEVLALVEARTGVSPDKLPLPPLGPELRD